MLFVLAAIWITIRHVMGWDNGASLGYLFQSGSGSTLELAAWGTLVFAWRTSCQEKRWCIRHGSKTVTDAHGMQHKVCWRHAGLPRKYGVHWSHGKPYLGDRPGRG
jgi:hypothetical protein